MRFDSIALTRAIVAASLALGASQQSGFAADNACGPVYLAFKKSYGQPYHQVINEFEEGKPSRSEMIFDGRNLYMMISGQWFAAGAMENPFAGMVEEGTSGKDACHRLREETSDGQPATLYQIIRQVDGHAHESQTWISPDGRVLRMDDPGEKFDLRMDYAHVKAPANAKKIGT